MEIHVLKIYKFESGYLQTQWFKLCFMYAFLTDTIVTEILSIACNINMYLWPYNESLYYRPTGGWNLRHPASGGSFHCGLD